MTNNKIGKNSIYNLLKSFSTVFFPLVTFPYISRILQPENIGKYNFSSSIVTYFSMISSLGITTYAVRECAKFRANREKLNEIASQIFSINIWTTVVALIMCFVTVFTIPQLNEYTILILIQCISILFTTLGTDWINTAMEDFKYITLRTLGFQLLSLLLMVLFVNDVEDYLKYAIIMVFSSSGANLLNIFYRKKYCDIKLVLRVELKKHLKPIMTLFAMMLSQQIFINADITMLGFYRGDYEVGLYSAALRIYNVINQIIGSISWVVIPQISILFYEEKRQKTYEVLSYAYQYIMTIGIPCIIGMYFFSEEIIVLVGGESYSDAGEVVKILSITLGLASIACYVLNINIIASGKDRIALLACAVPAIINVLANFMFIPIYGMHAAAYTTAFSQILIIAICIPFIPKGFGQKAILRDNWKVYLAGILLVILCIIVDKMIINRWIVLMVTICVGGILYFGLLFILKYEFVYNVLKKIIKQRE